MGEIKADFELPAFNYEFRYNISLNSKAVSLFVILRHDDNQQRNYRVH